MSSVLDKPHVRNRITDDDWKVGATSTAATQRQMLVGYVTSVRRYTFPFLRGQLVVESEGSLPPWFKETVSALEEVGEIPENWNSYGAKQVSRTSILAAIELLLYVMDDETPVPAIVPTNRGTVILEWHTRGIDLEVEVLAHGRVHVAFEAARAGTEWEAEIGSDLTRLVDCIQLLSNSEQA